MTAIAAGLTTVACGLIACWCWYRAGIEAGVDRGKRAGYEEGLCAAAVRQAERCVRCQRRHVAICETILGHVPLDDRLQAWAQALQTQPHRVDE